MLKVKIIWEDEKREEERGGSSGEAGAVEVEEKKRDIYTL